MIDPRIKKLLEAGVHFGHQTRRWNPKMKPFIFTARNGIYIIDLNKTLKAIDIAKRKIEEVISSGKSILFVGTKKQAKTVMREEAGRAGVFHITERWLGGMLTNFHTIKGGIKRLKNIEKMREEGVIEKYTKKEQISIERQRVRLEKFLGGIKEMNYLPGLLFIVDSKKEKIAVAEASKLGIPIIAIIDTNADPDQIDFPIAANDDAIKSIRVITRELTDAILASKQGTSVSEMTGVNDAEQFEAAAVVNVSEEAAAPVVNEAPEAETAKENVKDGDSSSTETE